jgi:hypothetical protein
MENIYEDYLGGKYFANANELYEHENIKPSTTVHDRVLEHELRKRKRKLKEQANQHHNGEQHPESEIIINEPTNVKVYNHSEPIETQTPLEFKPEHNVHETQTDPEYRPIHTQTQHEMQEPIKHMVYTKPNVEYNPIVYTRLYDYGLRLIPSYFTYDQRTRLIEVLDDQIKRELINRVSEDRLEQTIKRVINSFNTPPKNQTTRKTSKKRSPKKKTSKKRSTRKTSKKRSTRKTSKKRSPKKTSRKAKK